MRKNLLLLRIPLVSFSILMSSFCFAQVTTAWVARYNGPVNDLDRANSMVVDASGNVYVTGRSANTGIAPDYATIKYNASGLQQWERRYNHGPGNTWETAWAITVDASGNVYVTGIGENGEIFGDEDFFTIKYDSDGNELWVSRYDGPGDDAGRSIAVDAFGNVYVSGESRQSTSPDLYTTGGIDDYLTIKYDADGNELWVRRYNGPADGDDSPAPGSMVIDESGNVFVTGKSSGIGTAYDIATIKYDTDGNELWVIRYAGPGASNEFGQQIAVDVTGNALITGNISFEGAPADMITIKYDTDGTELWSRSYDGPDHASDAAHALAVDALGNVYVTGVENGGVPGSERDIATVKYSSSGDQLWARSYNGPGDGRDEANSAAVDALGNVYVTGFSYGIGTERDYVTIKYNAEGVEQWVERYTGPDVDGDPGPDDKVDFANSMAVDASGNVYVTGASDGAGTDLDYATIKYVQPSPLAVAAGLDLTIFQGYGSLCVTLSAEASGGLPPYQYSWIPGNFTKQSILVCPTKTTTYTATAYDAGQNKAIDEVKVNVIDVRCGKKLEKVLVCHQGKKEFCVSKDEVKEHLAHGDILGACKAPPVPSDNPARAVITKLKLDPPSKFRVTNYPNPVSSVTSIQYEIPFDGRLAIKVYDVMGREVETLINADKKVGYHNTYFNVSLLKNGLYYYRAILNGENKIVTQSGTIIVVK